jgi:uncharacterized protein YunC (DUF1805 family)
VVTATPAEDYEFVEWALEDGTQVSDDPTYTFDMPSMDLILVAHFQEIVSVGDLQINEISIYPNPASQVVNVRGNEPVLAVTLFSITGQMIVNKTNLNDDLVQISVSGLETGIYLLRIQTSNGFITRRIEIVR